MGSDNPLARAHCAAGDTCSVRIHGVDRFDNSAVLSEDTLVAMVASPDGTETPLSIVAQKGAISSQKDKSGSNGKSAFEVRYDAIKSGLHELRVFLRDQMIVGSPISFKVLPSVPTPEKSRLEPPDNAEDLPVSMETPSAVILRTFDRFGNGESPYFSRSHK